MLGSHDDELMCVTVQKSDKRNNAGHVTDKSPPSSPRLHDDTRNVQYYLYLPHSCDITLDYHEHRRISSLCLFLTCVSFFYPFTGTRMKTVLCWKPVSVTMWPSWCVSTLRGTDDPTTTQCACDHLRRANLGLTRQLFCMQEEDGAQQEIFWRPAGQEAQTHHDQS